MTSRIVILDEAETELAEAEAWYEAQRAGLGTEFLDAVAEAMQLLSENPIPSVPVPDVDDVVGVRRLFVKRFPFSVVFVHATNVIWVIAFAHHRQRPGYWKSRNTDVSGSS